MPRMRTLPLPRYVEAASVDEGDTIRVTWKVGDIEHTRTAKVGRIVHDRFSKQFLSPQGNEICRTGHNTKLRFTLVAEHEAPAEQLSLFDPEYGSGECVGMSGTTSWNKESA